MAGGTPQPDATRAGASQLQWSTRPRALGLCAGKGARPNHTTIRVYRLNGFVEEELGHCALCTISMEKVPWKADMRYSEKEQIALSQGTTDLSIPLQSR